MPFHLSKAYLRQQSRGPLALVTQEYVCAHLLLQDVSNIAAYLRCILVVCTWEGSHAACCISPAYIPLDRVTARDRQYICKEENKSFLLTIERTAMYRKRSGCIHAIVGRGTCYGREHILNDRTPQLRSTPPVHARIHLETFFGSTYVGIRYPIYTSPNPADWSSC